MMNTDYALLIEQAKALTAGVDDFISNISNISALIYSSLDRLNWAGFYIMKNGELKLGPFQGKPACVRIPVGRGVCGTAVSENSTQLVPDVHAFPGHIACDGASNSEIVIPIRKGGAVVGVLDVDSPELDRFSEADACGLEELVKHIEEIWTI